MLMFGYEVAVTSLDLYPSLRPVAAVQIPVSDGFGDVHGLDLFAAGEVGNGAGHLEDAAVGTGVS